MPRRPPKNTTEKPNIEESLKKKQQLEDLIFSNETLDGLISPDIPSMKPERIMNFDALKNVTSTFNIQNLKKISNNLVVLSSTHLSSNLLLLNSQSNPDLVIA